MRNHDKYEPKEMTPQERMRDQAKFWAYSGRDIMSQRRENRYAISKECLDKALALYRRIAQEYPSVRSQMDIYDTLRISLDLYFRINTREAMQEAKTSMEEALQIIHGCVKAGPNNAELVGKQIDTLQYLGGICRDLGGRKNLLLARKYFEQSIHVCDKHFTDRFSFVQYDQMAHGLEQFAMTNTALYGAEAAATAQKCLTTALELRIKGFRKNFSTSGMALANAYTWLGDACRDLGGNSDLKSAARYYKMAHQIWIFVRSKHESIYYATLHIGVLYRMAMLSITPKEMARQYLTQAIEIAKTIAPVKGYEQWKGYVQLLQQFHDRI